MIAFSLYDTVVYSNVWFFLDGVGLTLKNMTTCSTSVCLLVSILYVCTGCFVLFVSCNKKNCLECIFCHFHVVSLSLLGLFSCLIDGFQKWISNMQNLHYWLVLSPSSNTSRKELLRGFGCSFISQCCFIWQLWAPVLCVLLYHTVQTEI